MTRTTAVKRRLIGIVGCVLMLGVNPLPAQSTILPVQKPPAMSALVHKAALAPAAPLKTVAAPSVTAPVQKPSLIAAGLSGGAFSLDQIKKRFGADRDTRLSDADAARYAHIFAFQDVGDFDRADYEISQLQSALLMGHVLQHRYLSRHYVSGYGELRDWMKKYADHPGAEDIHKLAERKKPAKGAGTLVRPAAAGGIPVYRDMDLGPVARSYLDSRSFSGRQKQVVQDVRARLSKNPSAALQIIETAAAENLFNHTTHDALLSLVAQSYFYNGNLDKAFVYAAQSADRSGAELPMAGWIAGLAAWKNGAYDTAARYFAMTAEARRSSGWTAAAGAFWAARAHLRAYEPRKVSYWLQRAAEHPRTFYGILAMRALGMDQARFHWDVPALTDKRLRALTSVQAGRRALALVDAGLPDRAAEELRRINPGKNRQLQEAMFALTAYAGMPQLALRMGSAFQSGNGDFYDAALYPDTPWVPEGGYKADRALLHAFMRQESRFSPTARNRTSGARGLMQLMPATAQHVAQISGQSVETGDLLDPQVNVTLGQEYLTHLLAHPQVKGNLFKLMVAYNAGPGKLARWDAEMDYDEDPLLFIESIPVAETRVFVERVMANFWIYRLKYNQDAESLDHVVGGGWPVYVAQDTTRRANKMADAGWMVTR